VAFMKKHKFAYTEAFNGLEALNKYKEAEGRFDFVLMGAYILSGPNLRYNRLTKW
jgi:hypothetical protein